MNENFFAKIVNDVLKHEGGYVNDPDDPGGETNFGISKRSYPNEDIRSLTPERAKSIYYRDFWLKSKCNLIPDIDVAAKVFDLSVNLGVSGAIKTLQRALRCFEFHLEEDGIPGPKTAAAVAAADPKGLLCAIKSEAAGQYRMMCALNSGLKKFLPGWLNRAYS
jgi:lysozyme family protein